MQMTRATFHIFVLKTVRYKSSIYLHGSVYTVHWTKTNGISHNTIGAQFTYYISNLTIFQNQTRKTEFKILLLTVTGVTKFLSYNNMYLIFMEGRGGKVNL